MLSQPAGLSGQDFRETQPRLRLLWGHDRWDVCACMHTWVPLLVTHGSRGTWHVGACMSLGARVPLKKAWAPLLIPPRDGALEEAAKQFWGAEEACCRAAGMQAPVLRERGAWVGVMGAHGRRDPARSAFDLHATLPSLTV